MKRLRQATYSGKPLGTEEFVARAKLLCEVQTLEGSARKKPVQSDGLLAGPVAPVCPYPVYDDCMLVRRWD